MESHLDLAGTTKFKPPKMPALTRAAKTFLTSRIHKSLMPMQVDTLTEHGPPWLRSTSGSKVPPR